MNNTENNAVVNPTTEELVTINRADIAPADVSVLTDVDSNFFCSIANDGSRASQVKIYNAINNKGESLDDNKGKVLEIVDVACHPVNLVDTNTGETINTLRVVLVDKDGKNYDAVSQGIVSSLQKIFAIVGQPSYNPPLKMKVVEQKTRSGFKTNTIELV